MLSAKIKYVFGSLLLFVYESMKWTKIMKCTEDLLSQYYIIYAAGLSVPSNIILEIIINKLKAYKQRKHLTPSEKK